VALHVLIDEHRGAFEYDWRTRFHLPLSSLPTSMDWGEAYRLTLALAGDPSSHVSASVSGWKYALSAESIVLRDLYDLQHQSKTTKKPKPYPRPWDTATQAIGKGTSMTPEEYHALRTRLARDN